MTTKWEINRAVRDSDLPAPSRLIMLTLSDIAEAGTAEIPEKHTPSLKVLAHETGLDKSTVTRHLASLEEAGWIRRDRPTLEDARRFGERTCYQLALPEVGAEDDIDGAEEDMGMVHTAPTQGAENDMGGCTEQQIGVEPDLDDHSYLSTSPKSSKTSAKRKPKGKTKAKQKAKPEALREDVERICNHLADRLVANGCKRPVIGKGWRDAARLMLDRDGYTEALVIGCITWATSNPFWRKNILSMPKVRERYEQLRLAAQEERERAKGGGKPNSYVKPASTAPDLIPADEQCPNPDHRGQRASTCRICASQRKAGTP